MITFLAFLNSGFLSFIGFVQIDSAQQARELVNKMRSENIEEREEATQKLRLLGKTAEGELRKVVQDSDPEVAGRARVLLRRLEIQSKLSAAFRKTFPEVEDRMASGNDHDWTEVFLQATLRDKGSYPNLKEEDLQALGSLAIMGALYRDEKTKICKAIRFNLLYHTAPEVLGLLQDRDPEVRREAAQTVGWMGVPEAIPSLRKMLVDPDGNVRSTVGPLLGVMGAKEAIPDLIKLLDDKESFVRWGAVGALGNLDAGAAIPRITELLGDQAVREMSLKILPKLDARMAIPKIMPHLADQNGSIRAATARALADLGAKESAPELAKLLRDKDPYVRVTAVMALGSLQAQDTATDIADLLDDKYPVVRALAADALGNLGDATTAQRLKKALKDKNAYVRSQAAHGLSRLGLKEDAKDLEELLKDTERISESLDEAFNYEGAGNFGDLWENIHSGLGKNREKLTVRSFVGAALCALGSASGVESLLEAVGEWGDGYDPFVLNALRQPEAWEALRGKRLHKQFHGKVSELLGPIAEHCGDRIECDPRDLERVVVAGSAKGPTWRWVEGTPFLEALEKMLWERGCTVIIESDRIRAVPRLDAKTFWRTWLKERRK